MKLRAEIEGEELTADVRREGARVSAEVGGRRYELEAHAFGEGEFLLLHEGRVYECRAAAAGAAGTIEVHVGGRAYEVALSDPKRLRGARSAAAHDAGRAQIVAQMPGRVVRVMVEPGQEVEAGQPVVVVEAMKMQNEMKSPKAGAVVELRARAGATVNAGDVLVVIE
ncbi:MAG TPA: biotin/lipoyl-containing protein [Pyrinomonadaceae bacterium]|nr:biotin/lipoyl-containing protein [Pyrinomonadaceae bacterium]